MNNRAAKFRLLEHESQQIFMGITAILQELGIGYALGRGFCYIVEKPEPVTLKAKTLTINNNFLKILIKREIETSTDERLLVLKKMSKTNQQRYLNLYTSKMEIVTQEMFASGQHPEHFGLTKPDGDINNYYLQ